MSTADDHFVRRVARMDPATGRVVAIEHPNSPVARRYSVRDLGRSDAPSAALPRQANVISLRMPPSLYAISGLDEIPDHVIEAQAISKGDGVKGRVHVVTGQNGEQRVGRYGWKAHIATLNQMVADAFANEIGANSVQAAQPPSAVAQKDGMVRAVAAYLRTLRIPGGVVP